MKKPDAVSVINETDFKQKIWPLPASELLYIGRATSEKLKKYNITDYSQISFLSITDDKELVLQISENQGVFIF